MHVHTGARLLRNLADGAALSADNGAHHVAGDQHAQREVSLTVGAAAATAAATHGAPKLVALTVIATLLCGRATAAMMLQFAVVLLHHELVALEIGAVQSVSGPAIIKCK